MGKEEESLQQQQRHDIGSSGGSSSVIFCERCGVGLTRISKDLSFRCVFVLILSLCLVVSSIFCILPFRVVKLDGFDANDEIKLGATVQACFKLQKPVSQLVQRIGMLEYDINDEIGIPNAKVAILSMHQSNASNLTDVVFGFLPDPINVPINLVSLIVLRSSLIDLFLRQSNLTLTASIFGQPSTFEILKFPGGITIIPLQNATIWRMPEILFNFTLNNSISEILEKFDELKDQLEFGLYLRPYENVFVQLTNSDGSTTSPPVTVQASVVSILGILLPQRLKQLAQTITDSPVKNLGLDNSVFGKVKSVRLSLYLQGTIQASSPTPSPAPSPELSDYADPPISPFPALSPFLSPAPSPSDCSSPCATSSKSRLCHSVPHANSPAPSIVTALPPHPSPDSGFTFLPKISLSYSQRTPLLHPVGPPQLSPDMSTFPGVSFGSRSGEGSESPSVAPSAEAPSPSSGPSYRAICLLGYYGLLIFHILCWQH